MAKWICGRRGWQNFYVFWLTVVVAAEIVNGTALMEEGYCAPYNGKVCKRFITSNQVWYSREGQGGWENERITESLWEEMISELSGLCRSAAEVIIIKFLG